MTSAVKRTRKQDRKDACDILAMLVNLEIHQAIDVLGWALHGRTHKAASGAASYSPTDPVELSDEYIEAQYAFSDKRGVNA